MADASSAKPQAKGGKKDKFKHSSANFQRLHGNPKKGGSGGRGAWGKPGDEVKFEDDNALDPHDPNYDSYDEEYFLLPADPEPTEEARRVFHASIADLRRFKEAVKNAVNEYFVSYDRDEFVRCIRDLNVTILHQEIPKVIILCSLDKDEEQRRKASFLLQHLYEHDIITRAQAEHGFLELYSRLPDLLLDTPQADTMLGQFVARAVAAEILQDEFAHRLYESWRLARNPQEHKQAKEAIRKMTLEYFESHDLAEFRRSLAELGSSSLHHIVVKTAISLSMDKSDQERELVSYLLATLTFDGLDALEVERGFELLLQRVEDLYNDVPRVLQYLSCFLARAVADECLPPAFLSRVNVLEQDMGYQVVQQANVLLKRTHAAARLANVWGPGDGRSVLLLKRDVKLMVDEFFESGDVSEAEKCIQDMNARYFHHEVVKTLVQMAAERAEEEVHKAIQLLKAMLSDGTVSKTQVHMGLSRIKSKIGDLSLDVPNASQVLTTVCQALDMKL